MAKRYSGNLQINVVYNDRGHYRTSVSSEGKLLWRGTVNPAPSGFGPGVAYDSPKAYDEVASSAIAFADDEVGGIADEAEYDEDLTGYLIKRSPHRKTAKALSSHARKKIDPHEAKHRLEASGIDFSRDFHTLPRREVDLLLETAKAAGYRKGKGAPGSTARMYFQYMSRLNSGKSTSAHARKKIDHYEARRNLEAAGIDFSRDFHTLSSSAVDLLLKAVNATGYRKRKDAPGSTARMYFQYLKGGFKAPQSSHATRHAGRKSSEAWSGMCPTGKHGLDFKGQSCDLCQKTPPAQLNAEIKRALAGKGVRF